MSSPDPSPGRRARRTTVLRLAAALSAAAALLYGAAIVYLITQETRLVFAAGRPLGEARPDFPYEQVELQAPGGARRIAWKMPRAEASTWVLYLHGNSATIASRVNIARYRDLRALGLNVFAPEYGGFAGLPGTPSETSLTADARAAFTYLTETLRVPPERIVVYGWSLGSAVAVHVAAEAREAALVLEGAPASLVAIGQREYPFFPIRLLMRNPFESILRIARVGSPVLFLHSPEDAVIPLSEGRRLYEAARGPKQFVEVAGGHIYANETDRDRFFGAIRAFLEDHDLLPPTH